MHITSRPLALDFPALETGRACSVSASFSYSKLAEAYEYGILDGSFGQVVSFASHYQTSFRIEVPLWHKVEDGVAFLGKEQQEAALPMLAKPVLPDNVPSPVSSSDAIADPHWAQTKKLRKQKRKKLKRKLTSLPRGRVVIRSIGACCKERRKPFSKRSLDDKYGQVAKWLLTGLAVAISRKSWHRLSKHRTCTVTPYWLLQRHFQQGYASDEKDAAKKPYSSAHAQSLYEDTWEALVTKIIRQGYNEGTNRFRTAREERDELEFYTTINQNNPLCVPRKQGREAGVKLPLIATRNTEMEHVTVSSASPIAPLLCIHVLRRHPKMLS